MRGTAKTIIISITVCVVFGLIAIAITAGLLGLNTAVLNAPAKVSITHEVIESFDNIKVQDIDCDICLYISDDGNAKVITTESGKIYNTVEVKNNALTVTRKDGRNWLERICYIGTDEPTVKIYLPQKEYESLIIKTVSGDIAVSDRFCFYNAEFETTSGEIYFSGEVLYDLHVDNTSGDITLDNVSADNAFVNNVSGETEMTSVTANKVISVDEVSGDIELKSCDAQSLDLNSISGDIEALLLTNKDYNTDTVSGNIRVPESDKSAGRCNASTVSGDINIAVR